MKWLPLCKFHIARMHQQATANQSYAATVHSRVVTELHIAIVVAQDVVGLIGGGPTAGAAVSAGYTLPLPLL